MVARNMRNLTEELLEGATDGALKKHRPDTSNRVNDASDSARELLGQAVNRYDYSPIDASKRAYTSGYVRQ
jgi:hypothetical protein